LQFLIDPATGFAGYEEAKTSQPIIDHFQLLLNLLEDKCDCGSKAVPVVKLRG
jgi:hypothetical protein